MATINTEALEVPVDDLLGKERSGKSDKEAVKSLRDILSIDKNTRVKLFDIIDTYIRDAITRQAYER